jgi:hypothetical protein
LLLFVPCVWRVEMILSSCTVFPFSCFFTIFPCFSWGKFALSYTTGLSLWFLIHCFWWYWALNSGLHAWQFITWATLPALWFLKYSSFVFPISMYIQAFDVHGYILYMAPPRPHSGKKWMLRIHSVLYSKVTPVYYYHMYIRSKHS